MTCESEVRGTYAVGGGLGGVFGIVEDKDLRRDCLGCDEEGVLRHVPCPIHLPLMVDLLHHLRMPDIFLCRLAMMKCVVRPSHAIPCLSIALTGMRHFFGADS